MSRKRDKPYFSRHVPYSFAKRRRPLPLQPDTSVDLPISDDNPSAAGATAKQQTTTVVVNGIPSDCSVLDLKSRFEIYGSISRTRMYPNGLAYMTYSSHDSAQSAISAALDPSFGITLLSKPVQVMWATDAVPQWREGVAKKEGLSSEAMSSKLIRAEVPLSRRGRGVRLGSAIVDPRDENIANGDTNNNYAKRGDGGGGDSSFGGTFKGREIVVYDDSL